MPSGKKVRTAQYTRHSEIQKTVKYSSRTSRPDKHTYSTQCVCTQGGNDDERGRVKGMFVCLRTQPEAVRADPCE